MSANILCKSCNPLLPENGWMLTGNEFRERLPDGRALWRIYVVTPNPG